MTWKTHAVIGANALWITALVGKIDATVFIYLPIAIVASLLPDIDAVQAKIHYLGHGLLHSFQGLFKGKYFHHRGFMHSLFATILFGGVIAIFSKGTELYLLPLIFMAAYFSHSIIDGFNTSVGYLYPVFMKRFALIPKSLQTPVGGAADNLLFFVGAFGIVLFFYLFQNSFTF